MLRCRDQAALSFSSSSSNRSCSSSVRQENSGLSWASPALACPASVSKTVVVLRSSSLGVRKTSPAASSFPRTSLAEPGWIPSCSVSCRWVMGPSFFRMVRILDWLPLPSKP